LAIKYLNSQENNLYGKKENLKASKIFCVLRTCPGVGGSSFSSTRLSVSVLGMISRPTGFLAFFSGCEKTS